MVVSEHLVDIEHVFWNDELSAATETVPESPVVRGDWRITHGMHGLDVQLITMRDRSGLPDWVDRMHNSRQVSGAQHCSAVVAAQVRGGGSSMRFRKRRTGAWVGRGVTAGLVVRLLGTPAAGAYGRLPGDDEPPGGQWVLACPGPCGAAPVVYDDLPAEDSPVWECGGCGRRREAQPPKLDEEW
jgi:hypothetical protein